MPPSGGQGGGGFCQSESKPVPELGLAGAGRAGLMLLPLLPLSQHPLRQQEVRSCDVVVLVRFQSPKKTERESEG